MRFHAGVQRGLALNPVLPARQMASVDLVSVDD